MNVLVAGATGLVGRCLVKELAKDKSIHTIYVLARRLVAFGIEKVRLLITDFDNMESALSGVEDVEAVYSCLGTTAAQTPDKAMYEKIEIHYPISIAKWARENGASQFHYISSIGTSVNAKNEYLSRKAVAEQKLKHMAIPQVFIYRPSFILGKRDQSRPLEQTAGVVLQLIKPLLRGKAKRYRPIAAESIAKAMAVLTTKVQPGVFIIESDEIAAIAAGAESETVQY